MGKSRSASGTSIKRLKQWFGTGKNKNQFNRDVKNASRKKKK